jgi:hypothetical protein
MINAGWYGDVIVGSGNEQAERSLSFGIVLIVLGAVALAY